MIKLSIVTVTYADKKGLDVTAQSVRSLKNSCPSEIEWIIIQSDAPFSFQNPVGADIVCYQEPAGIYSAMNLGLDQSSGSHILFLNSGDELQIFDGLSFLQDMKVSYYGDYSVADKGEVKSRKSKPVWYLMHGMPSSHQCFFYSRASVAKHVYDTTYPICADYDFTLRLWREGHPMERVKSSARAIFNLDGVSSRMLKNLRLEASKVQLENKLPIALIVFSYGLRFITHIRMRSVSQ
jgi:putative colanic acid biosynthesis glycosyltransferase